ncbi:GNAT family N-acetyltransferase [Neptunicoccus cionae]|uniref:GNAT family N-acetyltransferase n=1 Tax=Neptunicoccus cionae TaxID=2035344 RepID=UPI000C765FE0|nr:GNAT family N-acetyltransferase [Amylibacter cionae]PLS21782.1 GNAT family N-acetyltransferase [Amylibacter cionae]
MSLSVQKGDPRSPEATRLLQASHALMNELFPAESCHYLEIEDLCTPEITFLVVKDGTETIGCGALANKGEYGELKSMFTTPEARGKGAADALITELVKIAQEQNLPMVRLETGDKLTAAHKLYQKHGFTFRGPFGDYPEHPASLFMERTL